RDDVVGRVRILRLQAERAQVIRDQKGRQPLAEGGDEVERSPAQLAQQENAVADSLQLAEQRLELPLQAAARAVAQAEQARLAPVAPLQAVEPRADLARQPRDRRFGEEDQVVGDARHRRDQDDGLRAREPPDDRSDLSYLRGSRQRGAAEFHDDHGPDSAPKKIEGRIAPSPSRAALWPGAFRRKGLDQRSASPVNVRIAPVTAGCYCCCPPGPAGWA